MMEVKLNHLKIPFTLLVFSLSLLITYSCKKVDQGNNETVSTVYYLNSEIGDDANNGTSVEKPFKTLSRINKVRLKKGDRILLAAGQTFYGSLILNEVKGTEKKPVQISSYGNSGKNPEIDATGYANAILLENCSHIEINNLSLTANGKGQFEENSQIWNMRCGVLVHATKEGNYSHIYLQNLLI